MSQPPDSAPSGLELRAGWGGVFAFGPWWLLYAGPVAPTSLHRHHAIQLIAVPGPSVVSIPGQFCPGLGIEVIASGEPHRIDRFDPAAVVLFIDPQSEAGRAIRSRLGGDPAAARPPAPDRGAAGAEEPESWEDAVRIVESIVGSVGHERPAGHSSLLHPAVRGVLRDLPDQIVCGAPRVRLLAELAGVSPSRLSHLFTEQVGMPLRRYIQWLRLVAAAEHLSSGTSLTEAAHRAGFADGAHFSRVFRAAFGLTPSESVAHGRWLRP